ncbi:hypothetical protein [Methylobacterium oryzisoli]|uniref:hypothetical protein n=1 Tax=Methylobacterium oryzisoli TaxID=3385502 RepID=UPI0038911FB3
MPPAPPLSAAEALVLLDPGGAQGREALKLTLMTLILQGYVRIVPSPPSWFGGRRPPNLVAAGRDEAGLPPPAAAAMRFVREASGRQGRLQEVVRLARLDHGAGLKGFVRDLVRPALMRRGLLEPTRERVLFVPVERHRPTPAGEAERRRLADLMARAADIPTWLDRDPAQAAALAVALGGAILLVPALRPHLDQIAGMLRMQRDAGGDGGSGGTGDEAACRDGDLAGFDAALSDAFDGLDAFESGFDGAADGGRGDGGGDGGGGGD